MYLVKVVFFLGTAKSTARSKTRNVRMLGGNKQIIRMDMDWENAKVINALGGSKTHNKPTTKNYSFLNMNDLVVTKLLKSNNKTVLTV